MKPGIHDLSATPPPERLTTDVVIIGSGSGGGTAARVLAEAGRQVTVLEEGGDFTGKKLTQRDSQMYDQLYMDRGGRATVDLSIAVLQGRVLGGGGVINASDVVPIPPGVLEFWRRRHGLTELTDEAIRPHTDQALVDLSASRIREDQVNRANRLVRQGTDKLGLRGEVMMHNRVGCAGLGTCLIGCPIDAKQSPRMKAVPAAIAAGARFLTRTRAVRIEDSDRPMKRVIARTLDGRGYHETGELEIEARTVIVAANAIGTAQLLLRSGIGNEHVGRHVSLQPQLPISALFEDRVEAFYGIPQSYAVTEHEDEHNTEHGLWGFRMEPVMGTPGIVASLMPFTGHAGKAMMRRYPFIASALLLTPDDPSGRVTVTDEADGGRPVIHYDHLENHKVRLRQAIRMGARIYLAAGAKEVVVLTTPALRIRSEADLGEVDDLQFPPASAALVSAHQQGGVRMSSSPSSGAASPDGQVYGTKGVYVFDSSWFPSSSSSHTMTPIITLSRYLSERLLASV